MASHRQLALHARELQDALAIPYRAALCLAQANHALEVRNQLQLDEFNRRDAGEPSLVTRIAARRARRTAFDNMASVSYDLRVIANMLDIDFLWDLEDLAFGVPQAASVIHMLPQLGVSRAAAEPITDFWRGYVWAASGIPSLAQRCSAVLDACAHEPARAPIGALSDVAREVLSTLPRLAAVSERIARLLEQAFADDRRGDVCEEVLTTWRYLEAQLSVSWHCSRRLNVHWQQFHGITNPVDVGDRVLHTVDPDLWGSWPRDAAAWALGNS